MFWSKCGSQFIHSADHHSLPASIAHTLTNTTNTRPQNVSSYTNLHASCADKYVALLLPADSIAVRLVGYETKQRDDQDGTVDFYDYLLDLRPWLGDAFAERDFANFYVDSREQRNPDCGGSLIQPDEQSIHGRYCLYYTTSSALPLNETCRRLAGADPPAERLFWRGDILLVKYTGELGMGHKYVDTSYAMLATVADILKSAYVHQRLEKKAISDMEIEREMEAWSEFELQIVICTSSALTYSNSMANKIILVQEFVARNSLG